MKMYTRILASSLISFTVYGSNNNIDIEQIHEDHAEHKFIQHLPETELYRKTKEEIKDLYEKYYIFQNKVHGDQIQDIVRATSSAPTYLSSANSQILELDGETQTIRAKWEQITNEHPILHSINALVDSDFADYCVLLCPSSPLSSDIIDIIKNNTQVRNLTLKISQKDAQTKEVIESILKATRSLRDLSLRDNNLDSDDLEAFYESLLNLPHLESLDLSNNQLDERGASTLGYVLAKSFTLHFLTLDNNTLEDITFLTEGLEENKTLTDLSLRNINLNDEGLLALGNALKKNTSLLSLNLAQNNITDKGFFFLSMGLICNTTLQEIRLEGNQLSFKVTENFREHAIDSCLKALYSSSASFKDQELAIKAIFDSNNNSLKRRGLDAYLIKALSRTAEHIIENEQTLYTNIKNPTTDLLTKLEGARKLTAISDSEVRRQSLYSAFGINRFDSSDIRPLVNSFQALRTLMQDSQKDGEPTNHSYLSQVPIFSETEDLSSSLEIQQQAEGDASLKQAMARLSEGNIVQAKDLYHQYALQQMQEALSQELDFE